MYVSMNVELQNGGKKWSNKEIYEGKLMCWGVKQHNKIQTYIWKDKRKNLQHRIETCIPVCTWRLFYEWEVSE